MHENPPIGGVSEGLEPARRLFVLHAEGGAAPARRHDVRVVHLEARSHQALGVIDGGAVDVAQGHLVDDDPDAVVLEDAIALALLVERQLVLESGASTTAHGYAEARLGLLLAGEELPYLLRCDVGEIDHRHSILATRSTAILEILMPTAAELKQRIESALPGAEANVEDLT